MNSARPAGFRNQNVVRRHERSLPGSVPLRTGRDTVNGRDLRSVCGTPIEKDLKINKAVRGGIGYTPKIAFSPLCMRITVGVRAG